MNLSVFSNNSKKVVTAITLLALVMSSNPFWIFDSAELKDVKVILKNKDEITKMYSLVEADKVNIENAVVNLEGEKKSLALKTVDLSNEICSLESQIGNEEYDPTIKCNSENYSQIKEEKKQVAESIVENEAGNSSKASKGYAYDENGNKMKWMITRYYSPEYNQEYFKYSADRKSNGRVKWAGKFFPENDERRWSAFMADSLVQCGTPFQAKPSPGNFENVVNDLKHACGTPGIMPFKDTAGKTNNYFDESHAHKVIACDYNYISKIVDLWCSTVIKSSTAPNSPEWNNALACRAKLNKEVTFEIEWVGEAKCADAGNAINGAHLDVWVGYGNTALKELAKWNLLNLQQSSYNIWLDGKVTEPRDWLWANVNIYHNWIKKY